MEETNDDDNEIIEPDTQITDTEPGPDVEPDFDMEW